MNEEQQRKLKVFIHFKLNNLTRSQKALEDVMSKISRNAQARGLTPKILENLLNEK